MEYIFYILSIVFLLIVAKKFFFVTQENKEVLETKTTPKVVKKEVIKKKLFKKKIEKEVEVFYQLNVENIKLNLYAFYIFENQIIRELHKKITADLYWLNEPYYTIITKIFYYVDRQNLWIKSPKSKEIILNIRDQNGEIITTNSLKVLDLKEVVYNLTIEILKLKKQTKGFLSKENIQNILLPTLIYALSKCGNIDTRESDENVIIDNLIEIFCSDLTEESKLYLVPKNNSNYEAIIRFHESVTSIAQEYPNTIYSKNDAQEIVKKLQNFPKKRLASVF